MLKYLKEINIPVILETIEVFVAKISRDLDSINQDIMEHELDLALNFYDNLTQRNHWADVALTKHLKSLLYAPNLDLLETYFQRMLFLLEKDGATLDIEKAYILLNKLYEHRKKYLTSPRKGWWAYLTEQGWTGTNFILATLPLVLGALSGILMVVYLTVVTGFSLVDLLRKSKTFWFNRPHVGDRILTQSSLQVLQESHPSLDVEAFLNTQQPNQMGLSLKKIKTTAYVSYALVFFISLITLVTFFFPPIGVPALVFVGLAVLAVAGIAAQAYLIHQNRQIQLDQIAHEELVNTRILLDLVLDKVQTFRNKQPSAATLVRSKKQADFIIHTFSSLEKPKVTKVSKPKKPCKAEEDLHSPLSHEKGAFKD